MIPKEQLGPGVIELLADDEPRTFAQILPRFDTIEPHLEDCLAMLTRYGLLARVIQGGEALYSLTVTGHRERVRQAIGV
jgi:hypothetical protein